MTKNYFLIKFIQKKSLSKSKIFLLKFLFTKRVDNNIISFSVGAQNYTQQNTFQQINKFLKNTFLLLQK